MISVIVPVYNVEKYLDQCIESILTQTYKDYELILVDDGSTDGSGEMCEHYKNRDDRIIVIHKHNGGLSDARNAGTIKAKGNYITYIDSDDFVSPLYLETLHELLDKYNADLSVTGILQFYDGEELTKECIHRRESIYSGLEALKRVLYQDGMDTSACAMLVSADIAKKVNFPKGKYHEDDFTTYKYYLKAKKVAVANEFQYFYRQRSGSIMHSFREANIDELDAADNLVMYCSQNIPKLLNAANSKKFSDYCQVLLSDNNIRRNQPDQYDRIIRYLNAQKYKIIKDKRTRVKNKIAAFCLIIGYDFLKLVNRLIRKGK